MTILNRTIYALLILITLIIIFFLAMARIDQYLKIKAIDDCGKMTVFDKNSPNEGVRITYPVQDLYEKCIKDKGY